MGPKEQQGDVPIEASEMSPPSADVELARLVDDVARFVREEERWGRRVWSVPVGGLLGLMAGIVLTSLLALVKFMNPISALGILLVLTSGGMILARRRMTLVPTRSLALQRALLRLRRGARYDPGRAQEQYFEDVARINDGTSNSRGPGPKRPD